ncbi:hypothetical protein [Snuella sedimenti]|uniref:Uncharacterized protein n=1 Tax=Snuella sedimenti TaxID=2798802 RepID=A0A8J7IZ76_9FLAO|nr:hypothetical protein [Snuella sedimenti]MBJ6366532.1 hypothetical protein [Snuella sedimenti]
MNKILFLFVLILTTSCTERKSTEAEHVATYYKGFKKGDYKQISAVISDTLTIIEGDYTMVFTPETFYRQFKWDSVFKPVYKLVSLENRDEHIVAAVSVKSLRFEFLKNNPLTCEHRFHFKSGKITKIENLDCMDADWQIWQKERDSLVAWIKFNHPELDGFVHDLSAKGAMDYLNAIELYKNRQFKREK